MSDQDQSVRLREQVLDAIAERRALRIEGGLTKAFLGRPGEGEPLSSSGHRGILDYQPSELVVTVRAGTRLAELENVLGEQGQMLAFEPPHFGEGATIGGTIACGLSGPRRPYCGSARDLLLGVTVLNGRGEILRFGGQVMKNVAGFDVSRLMAGAFGTLGMLLDVSLKVLPRPAHEATRMFDLDLPAARQRIAQWGRQDLPVSALCYDGQRLYVRLSGAVPAVKDAECRLGGEFHPDGADFWTALREQRLPFFASPGDLWRVHLRTNAPTPEVDHGFWLDEWGGAQRWLKSTEEPSVLLQQLARSGGGITLFRPAAKERRGHFQPPFAGRLQDIQRGIKLAFDPHGLFNPKRLNEEF